jgi:peptidoglycan hydrolase CwlO-like protein
MDEELTTMQKFYNWSFVIVASLLCFLFLLTASVHAFNNQKRFSDRPVYGEPAMRTQAEISELKVQDEKLSGRIEKLATLVEEIAKNQKMHEERIYDLNSRVVWVYGPGGGAFGLMGFLQFLNVKKSRK